MLRSVAIVAFVLPSLLQACATVSLLPTSTSAVNAADLSLMAPRPVALSSNDFRDEALEMGWIDPPRSWIRVLSILTNGYKAKQGTPDLPEPTPFDVSRDKGIISEHITRAQYLLEAVRLAAQAIQVTEVRRRDLHDLEATLVTAIRVERQFGKACTPLLCLHAEKVVGAIHDDIAIIKFLADRWSLELHSKKEMAPMG